MRKSSKIRTKNKKIKIYFASSYKEMMLLALKEFILIKIVHCPNYLILLSNPKISVWLQNIDLESKICFYFSLNGNRLFYVDHYPKQLS
jgi:hypothetical protein